MYLYIALLYLFVMPGSFSNDNIHKFMSNEQLQQVFQTDHDSVPNYEVVRVEVSQRLQKRDLSEGSHIRMRAFGEDINLWLHPADSILAGIDTPVYYARYSPSKPLGVEYRRREGLMEMVGRIFEDPNMMASFVIGTEENGTPRVNGNIGSKKIVVRSLPPRIAKEYRRHRSIDDLDQPDSSYHVVFKSNDEVDEVRSPSLPVNKTSLGQRFSRSAIPPILYPEVLVVVENSVYITGERDIYGFLEYLLAFWNGVDLRYRSLDNPRVRLHIAGIVLSVDAAATPYISNNAIASSVFNSTQAMQDVPRFYYGIKDSIPLDSYDIAITMTRLRFGLDGDGGIQGLARAGLACKRSNYFETVDGVALIQDRGTFDGIHIAAHEVGHLLGALHDTNTKDCIYSNGFIMSPTMISTTNTSDFSSCSLKSFQIALESGRLSCLYNTPQLHGKKLPKLMPGRMRSLKEQCNDAYMETSCQPESQNTSLCVRIYCFNGIECKQTTHPALDGTPCEGRNKFCLHQQCVSL